MGVLRAVGRKLPDPVKKIIRSALPAAPVPQNPAAANPHDKTREYVAAGAEPVHSIKDMGPLSAIWLRQTIAEYDTAAEARRNAMSVAIFNEVSKYPRGADAILTAYSSKLFGSHPLYRRIVAARALGEGEYERAFDVLHVLAEQQKTAFDAAMAAWPLMRPAGREDAAVKYLEAQSTVYPDDLVLRVHLATALYCDRQTQRANAEIAKIKPALDALLAGGYGWHLSGLREELDKALADKAVYRRFSFDETSYREDLIQNHWDPYFHWMRTQSEHVMFGWLRRFFADKLTDLGRGVDEVYNFGVMCAQPDFEAAKTLTGTRFVGVDRQQTTADLNNHAFILPNIAFAGAEIEDVVSSLSAGPTRALFHARTATLCYPEKICQLYQACAEKGFTRIGLFENIALSHDAYRFYDMGGDIDRSSTIYKSDQFIHDYKAMLSDAGFAITKEERMFSPLITPFSEIDLGSAHVYLEAQRRT
jgi:hypothetical protein